MQLHRRFSLVAPFMAILVSQIFIPLQAKAQTPPAPGTSATKVQQQIDALGLRNTLRTRIAAMGLTNDQVRQRLGSLGYDPTSLDPYLDDRVTNPPEPSDALVRALQSIGVLEVPSVPLQTKPILQDSTPPKRDGELRIFGLDVFARATTEFQPMTVGPVPEDYILGPGDEIVLVITGDVEFSYTLPVTREGFILVPQVGQVWVNGLTLRQLRDQMYTQLGRVYSGVRRGADATTHFDVSLGRLRTNQVFVTGEVRQPGTYLVSGVAGLLNALYLAGGPTENASLRDVRVMRGSRIAFHVDLYDYLLRGNNLDSVRLAPGDVVFATVHGDRVAVQGEVERPGIYEIKAGETLLDVIQNAGGVSTPALLRRARIERILPPEQRTNPGIDRVITDVSLADIIRHPESAPKLNAGDVVTVFPIRSELRNAVALQGSVWQEGMFAYKPGMTAWDLIRMGGGLQPDAYIPRAQITRIDPSDSTLSVIAFSLATTSNGTPVENPLLQEFDAVVVTSTAAATEHFPVTISGEVVRPHEQDFREGMTLRDLILSAGGLKSTADLDIEIARLASPEQRTQGSSVNLLHVKVDSTYFVGTSNKQYYFGSKDSLTLRPTDVLLEPYDQVRVRRVPDLDFKRVVQIDGQVKYPGTYALADQSEHLSDFLARTGGFRQNAFPGGFRFYRNGALVDVDLPEVLRNPKRADNLVLLPGDSMYLPEYNPVVIVQGAVNSPSAVAWRPDRGLEYYIESAGGYAQTADEGRVYVRFANGHTKVKKKHLFFSTAPTPGPGSVVVVAAEDPNHRQDIRGLIGDLAQIFATIGTLAIVALR